MVVVFVHNTRNTGGEVKFVVCESAFQGSISAELRRATGSIPGSQSGYNAAGTTKSALGARPPVHDPPRHRRCVRGPNRSHDMLVVRCLLDSETAILRDGRR